jgi:hypothetical protein
MDGCEREARAGRRARRREATARRLSAAHRIGRVRRRWNDAIDWRPRGRVDGYQPSREVDLDPPCAVCS